jgi:2-polyprenyl-6-hydroxyphenyl methylase/3-demethylubiquinone-9 3-methyltransferase
LQARLAFIREAAAAHFGAPELAVPLRGLSALDVGCGGGLLAEPLARLGANVVGLDATEENVLAARVHAAREPRLTDRLQYTHDTVEGLVEQGKSFDLVIASEARCLKSRAFPLPLRCCVASEWAVVSTHQKQAKAKGC